MQTAAQAQEMEHKADTRELDLSDPGTAKMVLQALTDKQAVYLYLYYGQWLSLREIAELLGIKSHQSVMISIHTGLRNIGRVFASGRIEKILPNGSSGFIRGEDGRSFYFSFKDARCRRDKLQPEAEVRFALEERLDRKKNQWKENAVEITVP